MTVRNTPVQDDKINNKIWKIARFVPYFALSFEKLEVLEHDGRKKSCYCRVSGKGWDNSEISRKGLYSEVQLRTHT